MENHPIPQDVTGFQFKLIGNMTIKQFAYVAFGVIMAVILYYMPVHFLLKIIFIPLFGGSGIAIAFLPIEGRPIDVMFGNFLKAIASPNQYIYNKTGRQFSFAALASPKTQTTTQSFVKTPTPVVTKKQQLQDFLQSRPAHDLSKLDEKESAFLKSVAIPAVIPVVVTQPAMQPVAQPASQQSAAQLSSVSNQAQTLNQQETKLTEELAEAKKGEDGTPKVDTLERQVQALHFQRQQLELQLQQLQAQLTSNQPQQRVRNIPKEMIRSAGLPHVSDTPNVIVGIVKDARGNVLPGMLVEVKDKENSPVRAFKTNQLGQFASATPLAPGTYTIELEDPKKQHSFDVIQIAANNEILLPIEITSHDAREELRKQLFN